MENLQYPIGRFDFTNGNDLSFTSQWINDIAMLPQAITSLIKSWSSSNKLNQVYRPQGWTAAQVIHHLADSHINAYMRFKLALTEDNPTIKPYLETKWAQFSDAQSTDISSSIQIINGIHYRWVDCLKDMSNDDFNRCFYHPEQDKKISLLENLAAYSWHSRHHLGHLKIIDKLA